MTKQLKANSNVSVPVTMKLVNSASCVQCVALVSQCNYANFKDNALQHQQLCLLQWNFKV